MEKFLKIGLLILVILLVISIFSDGFKKIPSFGSENFSSQEAGEKALNYINHNLLQGATADLIAIEEERDLYKIKLKIGDQDFDSYITKDGKFLFPQGINLDEKITENPEGDNQENQSQEISKRDKPDLKLFAMSYCPFGLQAEKAFLPVYDLLKEKADMGIYFVDYAMHGKKEIDENLRQYCVQKEEKEKYSAYLNCFVKEDNFTKCLDEAKIDKTKLNSCISATDEEYSITAQYNDKDSWLNGRYPEFDVHGDLNEKYEVRGSPTFIINDKVVNINPRSPENLKKIVCQSFTTAPPGCSQTLSNDVASTGFGGGTSPSSSGSCE